MSCTVKLIPAVVRCERFKLDEVGFEVRLPSYLSGLMMGLVLDPELKRLSRLALDLVGVVGVR